MTKSDSSWAYRETWTGPGIGEVFVNREAGLGLIRIPKCASSSAAKAWQTAEKVIITDSDFHGIDIYAAVREPRARFFSALAESLFRLSLDGSSWSGDLHVQPAIYERFVSLDGSSPASYARAVMRRMEEGEFLELHLTPMFHFLFRTDGSPRVPATLYLSSESDGVILEVAECYGISPSKAGPVRENVRKRGARYSKRSSLTTLKAHLARWRARIDGAHWRYFPSDHPVLQLSGLQSPLTSYQLGKTIEDFDREIRGDHQLTREVHKFVDEYYRQDASLYRLVESWTRSGATSVTLKTLITQVNADLKGTSGPGPGMSGDLKA